MRKLFENYRRLLARPRGKTLLVAAAGARMPQGMVGLALLLMVAHYYGVAFGGAAVACYSVGLGVLAPLRGRLVDRRGMLWTLRVTGAIYFAAVVLVILASALGAGAGWVLVASSAVGLSAPPLGPGVRAIWASIPDPGERRAGLAVDASFVDTSFIVGPLAVSGLQYLWPGAGLLAVLVLTAVGAVCLISVSSAREGGGEPSQPGRQVSHKKAGTLLGPLHIREFRRLLLVVVLVNGAVTGAMVGLPSIAKLTGAQWATGLLVAEVSIGSVVGALLWSRREANPRAHRELTFLAAGLGLTLAMLPLAGGHLPILVLVAPLAGLPIASTMATVAGLAHELSPVGAAEAQSWVVSFNQVGASASAAVVASVAQFGAARVALGIPSALAVFAALASLALASVRDRSKVEVSA